VTLADILSLETLGHDRWRAWTPSGSGRPDIFGGQVAGQALLAAARTVDAQYQANSVHCSFLRRGQPALPLDIYVDRTRAGRTYANRRVEVTQDGKLIFTMLASFHVDEPGAEYARPMPVDVPDPEALPDPPPPGWDPALEMRSLDGAPPTVQFWCRATGALPDDPAVHASGLLYASDMRAGGAAMFAIGFVPFGEPSLGRTPPPTPGNFGSLDHALWFHRPPRVDDWFFSYVEPIAVRDSRGLVLGTIFDRDRRHVATFTQEMFLKTAVPSTG
jgi:acyl-CoA thioesterase II